MATGVKTREETSVGFDFCSPVITRRDFMGERKKYGGWAFVLVSPKHISVNEEEGEIGGIKRKK